MDRELGHYSAGALQSVDPYHVELDGGGSNSRDNSPADSVPGRVSLAGDANALFLQELLATPPPEIGSLLGTGTDSEVPRLRRLLRNATDPAIEFRLRQQLDGYSSPPIAPYVRDSHGEWTDPNPAMAGG
jgi:hypothetical protein